MTTGGSSLSRMRLDASGFTAILVRSKTSGQGKKLAELPVFISSGAWFREEDWLRVGVRVWNSEEYPRDFFLCLPTRNRGSIEQFEAKYPDVLALNRKLLSRLRMTETASPGVLAPQSRTVLVRAFREGKSYQVGWERPGASRNTGWTSCGDGRLRAPWGTCVCSNQG